MIDTPKLSQGWRRVSQYAIAIDTPGGTYHVSKGLVAGKPRYTAWPPKPPHDLDLPWQERLHSPLGCFDDPDSAKRCCEDHADGR